MPKTIKPLQPLPALSETDIARYWKYVDKRGPDECWPWTGAGVSGDPPRYGRFWLCGALWPAHRVGYFLAKGEDPWPLLVCHTCDWPPCQNPDHFFKGSVKHNADDMMAKGRQVSSYGDNHGSRTHPESIVRGDKHPSHLRPWNLVRGEDHPNAKLTSVQVDEIRKKWASGKFMQKDLAAFYGVAQSLISHIVHGKKWKPSPVNPEDTVDWSGIFPA